MSTAEPLDQLADLNWTDYTCQNDDPECDSRATHIVEYHQVDNSNDDETLFGNIIELLCDPCLDTLRVRIATHIKQLARIPGRVACFTCCAPIHDETDILRSVRPLP